jgi:hypothetical protein
MTRRNLQPIESILVELSQRCFATRWYNGMSWWGYRFMTTGPQGAGRGQVTAHDIAQLKDAVADFDGGWMLYPLQMPAYLSKDRWMMVYGGGPDRVIQETRRLERKVQLAMDAEDYAWMDGLLQGTRPWF